MLFQPRLNSIRLGRSVVRTLFIGFISGLGLMMQSATAETIIDIIEYRQLPVELTKSEFFDASQVLSASPADVCRLTENGAVIFTQSGLCEVLAPTSDSTQSFTIVAHPALSESGELSVRQPSADAMRWAATLHRQATTPALPRLFDTLNSGTVIQGESILVNESLTDSGLLAIGRQASDPSVCRIEGNQVTFQGTGRCQVVASWFQPLFQELLIISEVLTSEAPAKQTQTIISQLPELYIVEADYDGSELLRVGENLITPIASASSGGSLLYTSLTPSVCILSDQDELKIQTVDEGLCRVRATQPGDDAFKAVETTLEMTVYNPCGKNPSVCQNGGLCSNWIEGQTWQCDCPRQYEGTRCEYPNTCRLYKDATGETPCVSGRCRSDSGGVRCEPNEGFKCACADAFDLSQFGANLSCAQMNLRATGAFCKDPTEVREFLQSLED